MSSSATISTWPIFGEAGVGFWVAEIAGAVGGEMDPGEHAPRSSAVADKAVRILEECFMEVSG
jgi:hypothetical protein